MMKFFKKYKAKETTILNVGIKRCDTCENNLRCEECTHEHEVFVLREENTNLKKEKETMQKHIDCLKTEIEGLKKHNKNKPQKRKYFRKCGLCGEKHEQSEMIRTEQVPNGWLCYDCYEKEGLE